MSDFPGRLPPQPKFKFTIFPSWFGGPKEADKAIVELANRQAKYEERVHRSGYACDVANIWVDRTDPNKWNVTVEFTT